MGRGVEITSLILIYNMAVRLTGPRMNPNATYVSLLPLSLLLQTMAI